MKGRTDLGTYYQIFISIVSSPRISVSEIARHVGHSGRGKRRATISHYLKLMYEYQISLRPNLILKTFEHPKRIAYLCRAKKRNKVGSTFLRLQNDKRINYILLISGYSDFFFTTRDENLDIEAYDLEITEKTILYTPIFTIPRGWKDSYEDAARKIMDFDFRKGLLERKTYGILQFSDLDMEIFRLLRVNARRPFTEVGAEVGVFSSTVKDHFLKSVLPHCEVAHYFFPKGYSTYMPNLFRIHSKHETSLSKALENLPCTSYVYPFEKGILLNIFHENINLMMGLMEKMEENEIIDSYVLLTPLHYFK